MSQLTRKFAPTASLATPVIARAASGVVYLYDPAELPQGRPCVLERAPQGVERWANPGSGFAVMRRIKDMLDPQGLLNKGALYGRI